MARTPCTEPQSLYRRSIPLLPLWAVRPVQSLSACTRAYFINIWESWCSLVSIDTSVWDGGYGDWIPVGARFSAPIQTGPGPHSASCTMGTGSFPEVKSGRCVTLTSHSPLVLWSWKSRAISLLPLWALRPVQSFGACTRVYFINIWESRCS
jgi:hypothetical protein